MADHLVPVRDRDEPELGGRTAAPVAKAHARLLSYQ